MNPSELRASLALSSIFALRMLGLFLILPIFSLHAKGLPDGDNATLVGLTMGIYGMVQAFFHIPLGLLSDRYGRRVIVAFGLSLFIIGALIAASHDDLWWIMFGRAIQGAGAISAAISAWVADLTREEVRTRAMALIGGSIAISFALSVVIATPLYHALGMPGIFWMMAILGCISLWVALQFVPTASMPVLSAPNGVRGHLNQLKKVFQNPELVRLNIGVLVLHTSQVALFLVIPRLLDEVGLPIADHWLVYLSVLVASLIIMMPMMMQPEVLNLNLSAPKFRLVLPFASFDRSTPTKFAGSILNLTALVACLLFVYLTGKHGFMSGKTLTVYIVAMIFTVATTIILSSSSYQMS
jgi:MFS family permease